MQRPSENIVLGLAVIACIVFVATSLEDRSEEVREREIEIEGLLESLKERYDKNEVSEEENRAYEKRDDVFVDMRWNPVYSDGSQVREDRVMNEITDKQIKVIINLHNKLRRQEGSSNMETLRYNPKLAALAQIWSHHCRFEHGQPPFDANTVGYKDLGQNIYAHENPKFTVAEAIHAWYDEKKDYNYNSISCAPGKVCGHYTAVAWAKTTEVGCGITYCPSISGLKNAHFIVCNYGPAGNFGGVKPFLKGPSCTQCDSGKFFCNNNLCDSSCKSAGSNCQCKAACKKCGTKDDAKCSCKCRPGTTGPDCSEDCVDKDPSCGRNPGLPEMVCNMPGFEFAKDKCPKMCHICAASDGKPCNARDDEMEERAEKPSLKSLMLGYLESQLREDEGDE